MGGGISNLSGGEGPGSKGNAGASNKSGGN